MSIEDLRLTEGGGSSSEMRHAQSATIKLVKNTEHTFYFCSDNNAIMYLPTYLYNVDTIRNKYPCTVCCKSTIKGWGGVTCGAEPCTCVLHMQYTI